MTAESLLKLADELRKDTKIAKCKHFAAAARKSRYHVVYGLPVIILNVFIGSVLLDALQKPQQASWASSVAPVLAFLAASLSGIQTFFNFDKVAEGHKRTACRYLRVSRECKFLIAKYKASQLTDGNFVKRLDELKETYEKINEESEQFPTSERDFEKAKNNVGVTPFEP